MKWGWKQTYHSKPQIAHRHGSSQADAIHTNSSNNGRFAGRATMRVRTIGTCLPPRAVLGAAAVFSAMLAGIAGVDAQQWPVKPVRLVVPFAPGGATDVLGRIASEKFSERIGQPVVIENKPGAGGSLAASMVARAAPDGHTLFIASSPSFVVAKALSDNPGFDPLKDFVAITLLATQGMLLNLHPSLKPNTVAEFVAYAKANPGKLSYATPGIGTPHHLAMELLKLSAGIDVVHVPYRGGGPMTKDVVAGAVPVMFGSYVIAGPYLKSGRLKAIGASTIARIPQAPEIKPIAEQGYPGFDVESWFGLVAPTGTPAPVVAKIAKEMQAALQIPEIMDRMSKIGLDPAPLLTVEQYSARLKGDVAKWSKVVMAAKIKAQ
jgi:tripartite-type tricarboxylate transporter receptor subunit TctC